MLRAVSVRRAGEPGRAPFDVAVLAHDERHLRRRVVTLKSGDKVLVDFPEPLSLGDGDALILDDGRAAGIVAAREDLLDIRGRDPDHLAELAWHIGNRHLAAAIEAPRILILRDHVIKAMLEGLGADVREVHEPFSPLGGAYSGGHGHRHEHGHAHEHGHRHGDHHGHDDDHGPHASHRPGAARHRHDGEPIAPAALIRLQNLLSPAFPVGSFAYSHGLEAAVEGGRILDAASLEAWLTPLIAFGSGWNDAVLLAEAWRRVRGGTDVAELADLGTALAGSLERHTETTLQGAAFITAARSGWPGATLDTLPDPCPYPVAVGAIAAAHGLPLEAAVAAFLQAFAGNLAQAAIRLGVVGQNGAVAVIAALEASILEAAARAAASDLDALGSATVLSEIMAMRHETKYSRLFRS